MNSGYLLIIFLGTIIYFLMLLAVFGYLGLPTKYYYVIIANYAAIVIYYYYKYTYYNLNTNSATELNKNV
jgi:hypothetical protein